jgi:hypothetical protein
MATERSRSKRDERDDTERDDGEPGRNGEAAIDEGELASYLQEPIKPGLNRGAIPLLARSIAREIARDEFHKDAPETDDAKADDDGEELNGDSDLAAGLQALQSQLGSDWILSLSVQGEDSWLVAEKADVSQRIEAQDASILRQAVKLLDQGGGRSSAGHGSD